MEGPREIAEKAESGQGPGRGGRFRVLARVDSSELPPRAGPEALRQIALSFHGPARLLGWETALGRPRWA